MGRQLTVDTVLRYIPSIFFCIMPFYIKSNQRKIASAVLRRSSVWSVGLHHVISFNTSLLTDA